MTNLSQKQVIKKPIPAYKSQHAEFDEQEFRTFIDDRGYDVIYEKAHLCPCKVKEATHRNICKNCGGVGWIFVNPTKTVMHMTSIMSDGKFANAQWIDWGMIDSGSAMVTSHNDEKMSFMDRLTVKNATTEHSQVVYPTMSDDGTQLFAFTKYNLLSIDYIALFVTPEEQLKKLEAGTDYTFRDNVLLFDSQYNDLENPAVTIRYVHNPVLHIVDVLRESLTSKKGSSNQSQKNLILPIKALAKKAHLLLDAENLAGNELLDNSWMPEQCEPEIASDFVRQLRYSSAQTLYDNLTSAQIIELDDLIHSSD